MKIVVLICVVHAQIIAKFRPEEALVLLKQAKDTGKGGLLNGSNSIDAEGE